MAEPIVVMHLRASNFVGGPEKQILEHLRRIDRQRFKPILCSFDSNGQPNQLLKAAEAENIQTVSLQSSSSFHPKQILKLRRCICANSVQILVTHGYKPNIIGYFSLKGLGVSQVVYSHGWTGESGKIRFYEFIDRQIMKLVRYTVAVSDGHKRQIVASGISEKKISVVHNAVSIPEPVEHVNIRKRYSIPTNATIVISAGRLSPEKNFSGLIDAAVPIINKHKSVFFIVLGEGILRQELEQQIVQAGLQGRFLLPGFTTDVQLLLADADIFVSSSHTEGLPVAVLEGAGAGLPVVATEVGGTPEVIRDGYNGLLVKAGDMVALQRAIDYLIDNLSEARKMGMLGAALVREDFDFSNHARRLEALYLRVANNAN